MGAKQLISGLFRRFKRKKRLISDKKHCATRGNAMVYVLLALALFGVLTATLSGQNADSDGQDIDDELVEFYANELLEYSAAAKSVIDQMILTGSTIDDLDFINPSSAGFDTPPHIHKVFHPEGGGLTYKASLNPEIEDEGDLVPPAGIYIGRFNNFDWTPTTATEVVLTFHQINRQVCEKINEKIRGTNSVLLYSSYPLQPHILDGSIAGHLTGTNSDFLTADCPDCNESPQMCIQGDHSWVSMYTILAAR